MNVKSGRGECYVSVSRGYVTVGGMRMLSVKAGVKCPGFESVVQAWGPGGFTSSRSLTPIIAHVWGVVGDRVCGRITPEGFSYAFRLSYSSGKAVAVK